MGLSFLQDLSIKSLGSNDSTPTIILSAICLVAGCYYLHNAYSHWSRKGIKGPRPIPLVGHFLHQITDRRLKYELEWPQKYGKVYGIFGGLRPRLAIADAEILLRICVKDFEAFPNHELSEFSSKVAHLTLIRLKDNHWKRTRAMMSPTFTSSRMKRMFRFMEICANDLIECLAGKLSNASAELAPKMSSVVVDVKDLYNLFTLDTISTCCYGLKLEPAGSSNKNAVAFRDDFVAKALKMFEIPVLRALIMVVVPKKITTMLNYKVTPDNMLNPFVNIMQRLVDQRRNSPKKFDDYLQLLIDARLDDKIELNDMDSAENHHVGLTSEALLKNQEQMIKDIREDSGKAKNLTNKFTLTDEEIIANAMFIMAAGLETTGSLLSHCTYALAFHPEIQERLRNEVMSIAEFDSETKKYKFNYDTLTSCKYLDAVLSETLRRLPPIIMLDRESSRDYYLEKYNIHIPKGSRLYLAYFAILNDPDYWPEPERFDPERFMPGNREKIVPGSYCPFGLGPRHCIGMRFSLTEAKLGMAKMLMNFEFEPAPGTKFPPEPGLIMAFTVFKNLVVNFKCRIF